MTQEEYQAKIIADGLENYRWNCDFHRGLMLKALKTFWVELRRWLFWRFRVRSYHLRPDGNPPWRFPRDPLFTRIRKRMAK